MLRDSYKNHTELFKNAHTRLCILSVLRLLSEQVVSWLSFIGYFLLLLGLCARVSCNPGWPLRGHGMSNSPKNCDYRQASLCLVYEVPGSKHRASYMYFYYTVYKAS